MDKRAGLGGRGQKGKHWDNCNRINNKYIYIYIYKIMIKPVFKRIKIELL